MTTTRDMTIAFRWRSVLGLSVGLFLAWGLINAALAIYVPYTLHTAGVTSIPLVLTTEADEALLGRTYATIAAEDQALAAYLVAFMDTMCGQMMAFAIAYTSVIWFGLRTGHIWALWVAAVAGLVAFVYFLPILDLYAQHSVPAGNSIAYIAVTVVAVAVATALGWYGLRAAAVGVSR